MSGPASGRFQGDVRIPGGRAVSLPFSGTISAGGVLTFDHNYSGTLTVTGGPTAYVFKVGRFKKLLSFLQNNSNGTNGSKVSVPVRSVAFDEAAGTVTVTFDTTVASSLIHGEFKLLA